jgi:hypothetical protein
MYDEISSDYPLPMPAGLPQSLHQRFAEESCEHGFQTKDLECLLEHYVITSEGRLLRTVRGRNAPALRLLTGIDQANHDEARDSDRPGDPSERGPVELVDVDFHGRLHLHTLLFVDDGGLTDLEGVRVRVVGPGFDGEAYAITYTLKFTDGCLVAVEDATATPLRRSS